MRACSARSFDVRIRAQRLVSTRRAGCRGPWLAERLLGDRLGVAARDDDALLVEGRIAHPCFPGALPVRRPYTARTAAQIVLLARQRGELEYADALARLRRDVLRCQGSRGQFEHQRQPMCSGLDFET